VIPLKDVDDDQLTPSVEYALFTLPTLANMDSSGDQQIAYWVPMLMLVLVQVFKSYERKNVPAVPVATNMFNSDAQHTAYVKLLFLLVHVATVSNPF
jgi:hypothetical protein